MHAVQLSSITSIISQEVINSFGVASVYGKWTTTDLKAYSTLNTVRFSICVRGYERLTGIKKPAEGTVTPNSGHGATEKVLE